MENAGCPLCTRDASRVVVRADFNLTGATACHQVVECLHCGFRYLAPQPSPDELAAYYTADYPAHALEQRPGETPSPEQASLNRRFARVASRRLELLRRYLPERPGRLRVLDVGCGNGAFLLALLRWDGVEAWGLDVAEAALTNLGQLNGRVRRVAGDLHRAGLPRGYFDLITLWHSLEHDSDPVGVLRRAGELLRPGGRVLAEVPNAAGTIARLCGHSWLGWDLPRHLVHFGPGSLRRTAVLAGLENVQVLRQYTLDPLCLSPLLASLALWQRRRRRSRRMKRVAYHRWDGMGDVLLRVVNGVERLLGGNGLLLAARAPRGETSRCAA